MPTTKKTNIPKGWKKEKINERKIKIIDGDRGKNYPKQDEFFKEEYCLFLNAGNVTKNGFSFDEVQFINREKDSLLRKGKIERNDLVITTRGTIGNLGYFNNGVKYNEVRINSGMAIIRNNDPEILTEFIIYFFRSNKFKKILKQLSFGSAQPQLTIQIINKLNLLLPPLPEQNRIVAVLETWDKYLEKLEKKIEIKKNIKKGLMQKLLTGKVRLEGFSGEWETVRLGDVCDFYRGNGIAKKDIKEDGISECILYGELFTKYKEYTKKVFSKTNKDEKVVRSVYGDILMPSSDVTPQGLGKATSLLKEGVILGGDINILRPNQDIESVFLSFLINLKKFRIIQLVTGTTIKHIYTKDLKLVKLKIPSKPEQTAIANILTIADKEITALEKQRDIIKDQKKYLLNNLITGKIRIRF